MDITARNYRDAADRLDAANEDFDAALATGNRAIIAECTAERESALTDLKVAKRAAGL